jgi:predicted dehydrogenase
MNKLLYQNKNISHMHNRDILIVGYGSIGKKKHTTTALALGLSPVVLTKYPERRKHVRFISDIKDAHDIEYAIVATPTSHHLEDVQNIIKHTSCKNILLEKPIESDLNKSIHVMKLAQDYKLNIHVAYCLRYLNVFNNIRNIIKDSENIRLVNVKAGMYLPEWRPDINYKRSYSASKLHGGGVHLDLSHELDYIFWLFGYPMEVLFKTFQKISKLEITSIDYFQIILKYPLFIVDLQVDYFRKRRRTLEIFGENRDILKCDFINSKLFYNGNEQRVHNLFNYHEMYENQLIEFINNKTLSTSLKEGIEIMKFITSGKDDS